ncbi:hypothetical protein LN042_23145 [Kitasatospora sp. RB6PN24]|uniref:hypothetical protein n=1 Tax=Kitasatospora humi TaxID=2893891 RepID=UPI001E2E2E68|nr:hypothetical protein [Kitasatospora humi]MCC9309933.1 hypothetical protein [Kitasatospora humi]
MLDPFTATRTRIERIDGRFTLHRSVSYHGSAGQALRHLLRHNWVGSLDTQAFHSACFTLNLGQQLRRVRRTAQATVTVTVALTTPHSLLRTGRRSDGERRGQLRRPGTTAAQRWSARTGDRELGGQQR